MKKRIFSLVTAVAIVLGCGISVAAEAGPGALHQEAAQQKATVNEDIIGFLVVPGTDIRTPVVQGSEEDANGFYLRRNLQKEYDFSGTSAADFRCTFGKELSRNTAIYIGGKYLDIIQGKSVAQLRRYQDPAYCKENPLIYFADLGKTMTWQVFAVAESDISIPFNVPNLGDQEWLETVAAVRKNAAYAAEDVTIGLEDHVLTLVMMDSISNTRFVIMAKRITTTETSTEELWDSQSPLTGC